MAFISFWHDEGEDLAGEVAFEGTDGIELGSPWATRRATNSLVLSSVRRLPMAMMCRALLALRSSPRLRRWRTVFPRKQEQG
jgi:hypothetical protein